MTGEGSVWAPGKLGFTPQPGAFLQQTTCSTGHGNPDWEWGISRFLRRIIRGDLVWSPLSIHRGHSWLHHSVTL